MSKGAKRRTIKQAYRQSGLPAEMGQSVNDFMAEFGIKNVQMGKKKYKVEKK